MARPAPGKRPPQQRKEAPAPQRSRPHGGHGPDVPTILPEDALGEMPDQPFAEGAADTIDPDLRYRMISEAAYHRYVDRSYADGYDIEDWLQAEAEVDHILLNPKS